MYFGILFIGLGGLEWEKGEIDYVRRKILLVCVFLYICLAKGNLIFPVTGWGFEASVI